MDRSKILILSTGLILAIAFFSSWHVLHQGIESPKDRTIEIIGRRYFYTPNRVAVNRGDRITLRLKSADVHHGLYLDGYELEMHAKPGEIGEFRFTADKTGRFNFRCSVTCGSFHPYMIGHLVVRPDYRLFGSIWAILLLTYMAAVLLWIRRPAAAVEKT